MEKMLFAFLILGISLSLTGCISEEEKETAEKYMLKYVYVEKHLELKKATYTQRFDFTAKHSSDRFKLLLYYLNFDPLFAQDDEEKISNIRKSLIGFLVEIYDQESQELISSNEITEAKNLSFSTATPSLSLGLVSKIEKKRVYEIIIRIPPKRDTKAEYLKPTFVAGILEDPRL